MYSRAKRIAALEILARTGMERGNYAPPLLWICWRVGINVPPPHFVPFRKIAIALGSYFTIAFALATGLALPLIRWFFEGRLWWGLLAASDVGAGVLFGLIMAAYYASGRRKHKLPGWQDLEPEL